MNRGHGQCCAAQARKSSARSSSTVRCCVGPRTIHGRSGSCSKTVSRSSTNVCRIPGRRHGHGARWLVRNRKYDRRVIGQRLRMFSRLLRAAVKRGDVLRRPFPLLEVMACTGPGAMVGKPVNVATDGRQDARGQTSGGAATTAERPTLVSELCKASVVAKAESVGRGLSGDGRFNRFDRTPGQTGAVCA